ncbi:adenylate kinase 9 [Lasioglossum baleicum]|uniref:adenylate kinase 9 n=1 Tax=Lasioglossum baleicum TaxID=434251 RepID=UPI003FCDF46F
MFDFYTRFRGLEEHRGRGRFTLDHFHFYPCKLIFTTTPSRSFPFFVLDQIRVASVSARCTLPRKSKDKGDQCAEARMAPKKAEEPERKPLIGRVGTNLKVGIVGIPNVGKSTFFNVLTKSQAAAENFPFCTIDPNENKTLNPVARSAMCDKVPRREKQVSRSKFYADTSFIVKKSFFRYIQGYPREECVVPWPEPHKCVYPKAISYYAFHEDANPLTRFDAKCESRRYGNVEPHFEPPSHPYTTRDPYCETDAKTKYLRTQPTCFVIFGKPDLNTSKLAAMIADAWKCVLVSPLQLVKDEIDQGSEKGKLISEILKTGENLDFDIIWNLVTTRINKRDVFHRGYVVEGLPIIPNELLEYPPSYSSKSNVEELRENFRKLFGQPLGGICGSDSAGKRKAPSNCVRDLHDESGCATRSRYEHFISNQIDEMFASWPLKPTIIIYVMCPDGDFAKKREHFRLDTGTGHTIDTTRSERKRNTETSLPDGTGNSANVSLELYHDPTSEERVSDENQGKYLLRRITDRRSNVEAQCNTYKRFAMPAIGKWILLHKPENVIRLDGRATVLRMFRTAISRLRTLPILRVILPKKLLDLSAMRYGGESPAPIDDFDDKSNEEAFPFLANRDTVSPTYPWGLSTWNFVCPVELARGRTVEGTPKFAVRFMNKIFFLSSDEAAELFLENPRTFVCPFVPRPTCKIAVFGPNLSGKSSLCQVLAATFRGVVVNADKSNSDSDIFFDSEQTSQDNANFLASRILRLPKEEIDVEVLRDGGYVVDGMYPDVDTWKAITESSGIVFEDAVLLYDEDPYEYLLSKWQEIHGAEEEHEEYEDGEEEAHGLAEYLRHIQQFQLDWEKIRETIENSCRNLIVCDIGKTDDVFGFVIDGIRDRYIDKARIMSDDERERERDLAEYMAMSDNTENVGEEEVLEEEERVTTPESNPRLGDTDQYCPVALIKHNVFWKGKEDFSAIFMDKIYRLSSESALREFVRSPQALSFPFRKPLSTIPPFRVSIIGPLGSGKSRLAKAIAREYGLAYVDHHESLNAFLVGSGIPPLLHRNVTISLRNYLEKVELPDDLEDEKYNSDPATLQTFVRGYWREGGALPQRMFRDCVLKCFDELYKLHGVAMEQFPSCPQDVEAALKHCTVPDIIIELECDKETARRRFMLDLLELWTNTLDKEKRIEQSRYTNAMDRYRRQESVWTKKRLSAAIKLLEAEGGDEETLWESSDEFATVDKVDDDDYDSSTVLDIDWQIIEHKRHELEEIWRQENPEPVFFTDWENYEVARERLGQEFDEAYEIDTRKIDATREALSNESIPYMKISATENFASVLLRLMINLKPYTSRDVTILERLYAIDLETAEMLLECGYYLLSSFGRWCPVQLYQKETPLQMYLVLEARQEIYPVIYRQFIYFLGGKDARSAFLKDPCKYVEQDSCAPVIPFRLSVIGPPKCGKTTLARQFAEKYGVKVITRGEALRQLLSNFPCTESAQAAESHLREGHRVPEEYVLRAVEISSIDPRSTAQGLVYDGFPSSRREFEKLSLLGIQPLVTIDLTADLDFCLRCLASQVDELPKKPANFSGKLLEHRYANWEIDRAEFREWLDKYTQNVVKLDASKSTWHVWTRADREACLRYARIQSYFRESDYDKCHSLKFMSVSPYEFKKRQSKFESYCPACLLRDGAMKSSGLVASHEGMIQFREHFYWVCEEHEADFTANPLNYLPPTNTATLPVDRARILTETIDVEHYCWMRRLRVDGYCLVSYVDNLPARTLVPGKTTIGALYKDKLYLFCTKEFRDKFLTYPDKYASVDIKFRRTLPPINVKDLPDLGFLEQTVAKTRRVPVPDARFDYLCEYFKPVSKVPAFLNVVDIAGLVKGAAEGQGLGNSFLSHINACDGIFHLCRAFDDDDVTHVEGDVNPVRDLEIISEELRLKDIEFLNGHLEKLEKLVVRGNDKKLKPEYDTLLKVKSVVVEENRHIRFADWSATDIEVLNKYLFLTSKPVIYLVNLSEKDYIRKKNKWLIKIKEWVDKNDPGAVLIPFSGAFENKLVDMDEAERAKYVEEQKVTSALDKIIVQGYKALQLQYFFTSGHDEVKAWTIQKGTKAPQAAGRIHTDFEKGFIMAEVMKFDDFKNEGSEAAVKAAGRYRQQGRNYVVEDGDIIFFKFNAGAGLKDAKKK